MTRVQALVLAIIVEVQTVSKIAMQISLYIGVKYMESILYTMTEQSSSDAELPTNRKTKHSLFTCSEPKNSHKS